MCTRHGPGAWSSAWEAGCLLLPRPAARSSAWELSSASVRRSRHGGAAAAAAVAGTAAAPAVAAAASGTASGTAAAVALASVVAAAAAAAGRAASAAATAAAGGAAGEGARGEAASTGGTVRSTASAWARSRSCFVREISLTLNLSNESADDDDATPRYAAAAATAPARSWPLRPEGDMSPPHARPWTAGAAPAEEGRSWRADGGGTKEVCSGCHSTRAAEADAGRLPGEARACMPPSDAEECVTALCCAAPPECDAAPDGMAQCTGGCLGQRGSLSAGGGGCSCTEARPPLSPRAGSELPPASAEEGAEEAAASPSQLLTPHSALAHSPTTPVTFGPRGPVCPPPRCEAALDGRVRRALAGRAPRCGPALDGRVRPLL